MRSAIIFSLLYSPVLDQPLCRYEISTHGFYCYIWLYRRSCLPRCRFDISHHFFTPVFDCIKAAAGRCTAMRTALIFLIIYLSVLKKPLCRYGISPHFLTSVLKMPLAAALLWDYPSFFNSNIFLYQRSRLPLCRYEIALIFWFVYFTVSKKPLYHYGTSPHLFTRIFDCIKEAACRCAAMRLALIFPHLSLTRLVQIN